MVAIPKIRQTTLAERIKAVQREIEELIESRAKQMKAECPSIPVEAIKQQIQRGQCICAAGIRLCEAEA